MVGRQALLTQKFFGGSFTDPFLFAYGLINFIKIIIRPIQLSRLQFQFTFRPLREVWPPFLKGTPQSPVISLTFFFPNASHFLQVLPDLTTDLSIAATCRVSSHQDQSMRNY